MFDINTWKTNPVKWYKGNSGESIYIFRLCNLTTTSYTENIAYLLVWYIWKRARARTKRNCCMGESFGFPHEILYNMVSVVTEITTSGYNKIGMMPVLVVPS